MATNELLQKVRAKAEAWLAPQYDEATRKEVQALLDNPDTTELVDAFYKDLEFGTGGLRGIMGAGSNRMNRYTVGTATVGTIALNSLAWWRVSSLPMASRSICTRHFALPQWSPMRSANWAARVV